MQGDRENRWEDPELGGSHLQEKAGQWLEGLRRSILVGNCNLLLTSRYILIDQMARVCVCMCVCACACMMDGR